MERTEMIDGIELISEMKRAKFALLNRETKAYAEMPKEGSILTFANESEGEAFLATVVNKSDQMRWAVVAISGTQIRRHKYFTIWSRATSGIYRVMPTISPRLRNPLRFWAI